MSSSGDWLARDREGVLKMAETWLTPIKTRGKVSWRMTEEEIEVFETALIEAQEANSVPKNLRNAKTNDTLKTSFTKLKTIMRDIKRRFFVVPNILESEIVLLGLKPKDTTPTTIGKPTAKGIVNITYTKNGALQANISFADSSAASDKSNYGFRIFYGVFSKDDAAPSSGKDLRESKFSRVKKVVFDFEPEDKGKTAYFCVRFENSKGETGVWGDLATAIIP